jgi:hypothetical protein
MFGLQTQGKEVKLPLVQIYISQKSTLPQPSLLSSIHYTTTIQWWLKFKNLHRMSPLLSSRYDDCARPRSARTADSSKLTISAFSGTAVKEGSFEEIKLSDYLGKWVILVFYPMVRRINSSHQSIRNFVLTR